MEAGLKSLPGVAREAERKWVVRLQRPGGSQAIQFTPSMGVSKRGPTYGGSQSVSPPTCKNVSVTPKSIPVLGSFPQGDRTPKSAGHTFQLSSNKAP